MTLIEVLAGLALLGTLLTVAILAFGQHVRQAQRAQERLMVVGLLDQLLGDWLSRDAVLTSPADGVLDPNSKYTWRRELVQNSHSSSASLGIVAVEVQNTSRPGHSVCRVELAVYIPPTAQAGQTQ